ncbi:MAG: acetolactate synthase small subunit [Candidatus Gastranaerophilales bacterium]|nr:acetolactate synthase small subunit [Candidatus Gastranaerophilales bacterium]
MSKHRHTLSVLVQNEAGVLSSLSGLFSGRGYNIESLTVAPTLDPAFSRVTIVTFGDDAVIEQISKQLNRLINTIKIVEFSSEDCIDREFVLCKVNVKEETRSDVLRVVEVSEGKVVNITPRVYTLQAIGNESQIATFIELLRPFGIKELVRSGKVVISRENEFINVKQNVGI